MCNSPIAKKIRIFEFVLASSSETSNGTGSCQAAWRERSTSKTMLASLLKKSIICAWLAGFCCRTIEVLLLFLNLDTRGPTKYESISLNNSENYMQLLKRKVETSSDVVLTDKTSFVFDGRKLPGKHHVAFIATFLEIN